MADVPCNGCTLCCRDQIVMLKPESGDVIDDYLHEPVTDPLTDRRGFALKQQKNGACVYLGMHGCTIHDRAPIVCKVFDCRRFFLRMGSNADRRHAVQSGFVSKEMLEAGRSRLHTLDSDEDD